MSSFPCKIIEADLDADIVTLQMEGDYTVSAGQKYLCDAAAASAEPVAAPKGWRLVPVSPTKEMLLAGETDEYGTAIWWDLMLAAAPAAPVAAQPDLTQQTLEDVMAGIPARDAEIEALQKENLALLHRAAIDAEVASRLARRLFEISAVISPDTPIAQHDISDLLARVKRVVSTLAQQVDKSPETQEKTVDKSPDLQGHASVIFAKAVAWADARVDAALTQPEQEGYGSACDDADQAHYELVQALRNLREAQQPVSGADGLAIELQGISEAIGNGGGVWRSCSGCHELNDGMATGPFSKTLKCHLGVGCSECGGIGAIWDTTDYDAMADFMAAKDQQNVENTETVVCLCNASQGKDADKVDAWRSDDVDLHAALSAEFSKHPQTKPVIGREALVLRCVRAAIDTARKEQA